MLVNSHDSGCEVENGGFHLLPPTLRLKLDKDFLLLWLTRSILFARFIAFCQDKLSEAKKRVQAARMAADDKQLQLKSREARVEDLNGKLNTAATNKEYQAIN